MGNKMRKDATFKGDRTGWLQGVKEQEKKKTNLRGRRVAPRSTLCPRCSCLLLAVSWRYYDDQRCVYIVDITAI